jgi:hypothetical protein
MIEKKIAAMITLDPLPIILIIILLLPHANQKVSKFVPGV